MSTDKTPVSKILIVDDTTTNIDLLRQLLEPEGYDILATTSGERALKIVGQCQPDLILLDVMMPGIDGYETCRRLQEAESSRDIPVIFITAKTEVEDMVKGFRLGAVDYLTKPVRRDELVARVRTHLRVQSLLKEQREKLVQVEKLAALGELVGQFTHEINTPMGTAMIALTHLQDETKGIRAAFNNGKLKKSSLGDYFSVCEEASRISVSNLQNAIEQVRSFKQVAVDQCSEARRTFRLKEYLEHILMTLKPKLKNTRHKVEIDCSPEIQLESYPGAFSQVLVNLLMNSLIHAYDQEDAGHIRIAAKIADGQLHLSYSDDGKGISEAHRARVFEKHFTTRRNKGGSGLGLHVLHDIVVRILGGQVSCDSTLGKGTKFLIIFPLIAE